ILGAAAEVRRSVERTRVIAALKDADGPLQAKDIWLAAELRNRNATDLLLSKMVKDGELVRADRGQYALPETDTEQIGQKERFEVQPPETQQDIGNLSDLSDLSEDRSKQATGDPWHIPEACRRPVNGRVPAGGPIGPCAVGPGGPEDDVGHLQ
ncbi:MAG: hypothetical protein ABWY92_19185, partial [Xanthobacteraceae bacterium]